VPNEALPVGLIFEYLALFDTANDDMVQGARGIFAGFAGHTFYIA
jgi:hypothetical protein